MAAPAELSYGLTKYPAWAATWPSCCHVVAGGEPPLLRNPPNKFCRHGAATSGACGAGKVGTLGSDCARFIAYARLLMSLLASRGVSGMRRQRHSISFSTEGGSNTRWFTCGLLGPPLATGERITWAP